jgi:hypothetical protein
MTLPTRRPGTDQNSDDEERDESSTTYQFACEYCDEVLRTETIDGMYERGARHLGNHSNDLLKSFAERPQRNRCENDCGYAFPVGVDSVGGFECPKCAYDNFDSFARQNLYWGMELISN